MSRFLLIRFIDGLLMFTQLTAAVSGLSLRGE